MAAALITTSASVTEGRERTRGGAPSKEAANTAVAQIPVEQEAQTLLESVKSAPSWKKYFDDIVENYVHFFRSNPKGCDRPVEGSKFTPCERERVNYDRSADSSFRMLLVEAKKDKTSDAIKKAANEKFKDMAMDVAKNKPKK